MPIIPWAYNGELTGTTAVTVIPAPAANKYRIVRSMMAFNPGTANANLTVRYVNGTSMQTMFREVLLPGSAFRFGERGEILVLDGTSKSIEMMTTGTSDAEPHYVTGGGDQS